MKKTMIILLCLALSCFLVGFFIATTSPDNVFIGLFVMGIGGVFALSSTIPAVKLTQQQNKLKEDRIKKLEEEVEQLKRNIHHK